MTNHEYKSYMVNTLRGIGADYQEKHGSMTFAKNGIVMVVDYNDSLDRCIGTIMTCYVYAELCKAYEKAHPCMSLASFAWSYGWGHDFFKDSCMEAIPAFQYAITIVSAPYWRMNQVGHVDEDVIYLVREYVDNLSKGEFGINDTYSLIGAFTDIKTAVNVASVANRDNVTVTIIPVLLNVTYVEGEKPFLGGGIWIE